MIAFSLQQIIEASTDHREPIPAVLPNGSRQRILEKLGFSMFDANGEAQAFRGILLAEIKRVFDQYQSVNHWKDSFARAVSPSEISTLLAGIELYHGAEGSVSVNSFNRIIVSSPGYQA